MSAWWTSGLCAALGLALFAPACAREAEPPQQPVAFSHAIHVGKRHTPCTNCHLGAERGARAGLPSLTQCLACHMKPQGEPPSERERIVREIAADGGALRWIQRTRNAGHVYFSHRAHVAIAKMTCGECHEGVETWAAPPKRGDSRLMDMDACMDCHRQRGAANGCRVCHR
jgi:c(7)-type cytochrome triheme protein